MKKCPLCSEEIKDSAIKCKHCKSDLSEIIKKEAIEKANKRANKQAMLLFKLFLLICVGVVLMAVKIYLLPLYLVVLVWSYPSKQDDKIMKRIYKFKLFKVRTILSVCLIILALGLFIMMLINSYKIKKEILEKQALEQQKIEFLKTIPKPEIIIKSSLENQGDKKNYKLVFVVNNADEVSINNELIEKNIDGEYIKVVNLDSVKTKLNLIAKNKHKNVKKEIIIIRNETLEEKKEAERIEKEAIRNMNWNYSISRDEMDNSKSYFAVASSENTINFEFPYNGGTSFDLMIRNDKRGNNVMLRCSKCQFIGTSPYDSERLRIKFDDNEFKYYGFAGPDNFDSEVVFIDNANVFISSLKRANKLKIEAPFYQEGRRVVNFDVQGFTWDK